MKQDFKITKEHIYKIVMQRITLDINIDKLCSIVGVSHVTYFNMVGFKKIPRLDVFLRFCKAVNIKTLEL